MDTSLALALLVLPALLSAANAADVKEPRASMRDGLSVRRRDHAGGQGEARGGDHVILFTDLPARALQSSIRVEGKATGALEIGSVDSRRMFVPRTDDVVAATERKRVEDAIEKLKDDRAVLQTAVQAAEMQKVLIGNLAQLPTRPAPASGAARPSPTGRSSRADRTAAGRGAEDHPRHADQGPRRRPAHQGLEGKLASLAPAQEERTEVKVFVNAGAPLEAEMSIRYQVGSASWVPFYDARLATGTKAQAPKLQLVRRASIQQRTERAGTRWRWRCPPPVRVPGRPHPDLQPVTIDYESEALHARSPPRGWAARSMTRDDRAAEVVEGDFAPSRHRRPSPAAGREVAPRSRRSLPGRLRHRRASPSRPR